LKAWGAKIKEREDRPGAPERVGGWGGVNESLFTVWTGPFSIVITFRY